MKTQFIIFHYIMVIVYPRDNEAVICYSKRGWTDINTPTFEISTKRRVSFEYALHYMIKYHMKMVQTKEYKGMFKAVKG